MIAALVGAEGLGQEVLAGLQHLDVGQAFDAGLAIVAVAIVLDRLTAGRPLRAARVPPRAHPERARAELIAGVAAVAIAVVAGKLWSSGAFPTSINFSLHDPVNHIVDWCRNHLRNGVPIIGGTGSISDFTVIHLLDPIRDFLVNRPWWVVVSGVTALAWATAGRRVAAVCAIALLVVAGLHADGSASGSIWVDTMDTLSQVLVAVVISMLIALPVGIVAGRSERFFAVIRPLLDAMQVMPAFVYLVPVIGLFNVGRVPGVIASVVYALPPGIRLTALGIREVPPGDDRGGPFDGRHQAADPHQGAAAARAALDHARPQPDDPHGAVGGDHRGPRRRWRAGGRCRLRSHQERARARRRSGIGDRRTRRRARSDDPGVGRSGSGRRGTHRCATSPGSQYPNQSEALDQMETA